MGARQIEDVWDKGKNKLSPDEERLHEEQRKSTPIGPDGQRVPRAFDLATTCTPHHLILVGAGNGASTSHDSSLKHAYTLTKEHLEQGRHEEAKKLCESVATKLVQEFGTERFEKLRFEELWTLCARSPRRSTWTGAGIKRQ